MSYWNGLCMCLEKDCKQEQLVSVVGVIKEILLDAYIKQPLYSTSSTTITNVVIAR